VKYLMPQVGVNDLRPWDAQPGPVRTDFHDPAVLFEWHGGRPNSEGTAVGTWKITRALLIKQNGHPPAIVFAPVIADTALRGMSAEETKP